MSISKNDLEVFALGGKSLKDDGTETGYFIVRRLERNYGQDLVRQGYDRLN